MKDTKNIFERAVKWNGNRDALHDLLPDVMFARVNEETDALRHTVLVLLQNEKLPTIQRVQLYIYRIRLDEANTTEAYKHLLSAEAGIAELDHICDAHDLQDSRLGQLKRQTAKYREWFEDQSLVPTEVFNPQAQTVPPATKASMPSPKVDPTPAYAVDGKPHYSPYMAGTTAQRNLDNDFGLDGRGGGFKSVAFDLSNNGRGSSLAYRPATPSAMRSQNTSSSGPFSSRFSANKQPSTPQLREGWNSNNTGSAGGRASGGLFSAGPRNTATGDQYSGGGRPISPYDTRNDGSRLFRSRSLRERKSTQGLSDAAKKASWRPL